VAEPTQSRTDAWWARLIFAGKETKGITNELVGKDELHQWYVSNIFQALSDLKNTGSEVRENRIDSRCVNGGWLYYGPRSSRSRLKVRLGSPPLEGASKSHSKSQTTLLTRRFVGLPSAASACPAAGSTISFFAANTSAALVPVVRLLPLVPDERGRALTSLGTTFPLLSALSSASPPIAPAVLRFFAFIAFSWTREDRRIWLSS
jgi:hypothetical protein